MVDSKGRLKVSLAKLSFQGLKRRPRLGQKRQFLERGLADQQGVAEKVSVKAQAILIARFRTAHPINLEQQ
jgi:hypothetical protein